MCTNLFERKQFMIKEYIKLIRPYQWIKNLFCLSGVVFGFHFNEPKLLLAAMCSFVTFCLASGSVYVLNDIFDIKLDQANPKKALRPIASGSISKVHAWIFYCVLVLCALSLSLSVGYVLLVITASYILMNVFYSLKGKHIVILDVFIITFGFLLRIFAGTYAININPSEWLVLCVITLTLFLGFAKRRAELLECERQSKVSAIKRQVLEHYEPKMLDIFISITASSSIISYALFVVIGKAIPNIVYTAIFVIYGIFRYIYLLYSHEKGGQDTANDLLDDKHLIVTVCLWLISYIIIMVYS